MKKLTALTAVVIMSAILISWQTLNERTFAITFTETQLNQLLYVINKSNAEHLTVAAVQENLISQAQKQLADTSKPASPKKP